MQENKSFVERLGTRPDTPDYRGEIVKPKYDRIISLGGTALTIGAIAYAMWHKKGGENLDKTPKGPQL